uniref:NADH dehydrogenase subunit 6 n=1 Tax=Agramma hupehanum TaxID=1964413 RepID=A0A343BT63_9HEMI|nr:NADH dehydrogenase subunit 6 [Agramma hupehanum]ARB50128.1 NADH dehydrogenase subunit 6 [Agramma hupehanum]
MNLWMMILCMFIMSSMTFMFLMNPLSMALMLVMQTLLISMISAVMISSFWYSYMLMLIMISGLLIMFMYMASIASNEKMNFSIKLSTFILMIPITMAMFKENLLKTKMFLMQYMSNNQEWIMTKLFNSKFIIPSLFMIIMLFLMMVIISFLVNISEGPMRKSN